MSDFIVLLLLLGAPGATAFLPAASPLHSASTLVDDMSLSREEMRLHSSMLHASSANTDSTIISPSSTTPSFDWKTEWYPVIPVQDLNPDTPNKITLLGKDFVVWYHSPSNSWRAFADVCPHRLVPLSEGRVESNGHLQCAYHGWEFNESGECVRIPQLPESRDSSAVSSPRACAMSFPIQVKQGLVWIFPTLNEEMAAMKPLPLIPEFDDPDFVDATNFFVRDMPYSWEVLVENLCDPSHVNFAHHSFMGGADRNSGSMVLDINVVKESPSGFQAQKDPYPINGGKYDVKFQAPCLLFYTLVSSSATSNDTDDSSKKKKGTFLGLGQFCIPTAPGRCRLIARFPFRLSFQPAMYIIRHTPRWITHFSQNVVMDSDVVFLSSQDQILARHAKEPNYYMPARCDAMVAAFRKWLAGNGKGGPEWIGIPAERSGGEPLGWLRPQYVPARGGRDALLDRYRQHTDVCSSCRRAHKSLYLVREIMTYAGIILFAAAAASGIATRSSGGIIVPRTAAIAGAAMLLLPRLFIRPLIARFECVPWPRKKWVQPTPSKLLSANRDT